MYHYLDDKEFLHDMRALSGEIMQLLCHYLKADYDIGAGFYLVGSGAKNLILQNENNPVDVGLSVSLFNGLSNSKSDYALCITGDQPTVSAETFNRMIETIQNSENPEKTISILRRRKTGLLDTAEGLGMPFAADRMELIKYLHDKDDNLNPILREIFADGFDFYGVKENHPNELININHYSEYESIL